MANRWGNSGNSVFILGGSKITADGDCSHEIKRCLLLGRKVMTNLESILKSRDITLPTKVYLVKAMVFPAVMYGCESWTIKKAECFWTVVLEKTLESPLDCKEIQPVHPRGDQSWVLIGREVMANIHSILKSGDIILPTNVHLIKAMIFPVVMYICESWTIKKDECWRTNAFKLWCWSWRSNMWVTWSKEPNVWKRPWIWEWLKAGGKGYNREWDGWMALLTQ